MSEIARTEPPAATPPLSAPPEPGTPVPVDAKNPRRFFDWLPWEKITIWGLVLLGIWVLRDFFFVIFMTFIVTYIMRSVIVRVVWLVARRRQAPLLERGLALVGFAALLGGLYLAGSWLWPPVENQFHVLKGKIEQFDANQFIEELGAKTIGAFLFNRKYGTTEEEAYEIAFQEWIDKGAVRERPLDYQTFADLDAPIRGAFEPSVVIDDLVDKRVLERTQEESAFHVWLLENIAQETFEQDHEQLIADYERGVLETLGQDALDALKASKDYERIRRERILDSLVRNLSNQTDLRNRWREALREKVRAELPKKEVEAALRESLRDIYEAKRASNSQYPPFERYLELREAFDKANAEGGSKAIFYAALGELPEEERDEKRLRDDFELAKKAELWWEWEKTPFARRARDVADKWVAEQLNKLGAKAQEALGYAFILPIHLALSLLVSFFITFDIPRLRRGVQKLKRSRVKNVYAEIAPGLISFGHLIGRAFQAQGVIALFNTLLTFLAIRFLGVDNEVVLCAIVFISSFIPVLGVVLSSVPIAIMAIIQPGGSVVLALEIVLAIIIIHFIETSILNPKILGDMLHLHPVFVLAVLAVGEHFFGVWGLLLGVPVAVYIIRFAILNEGIPGLIQPHPAPAQDGAGGGTQGTLPTAPEPPSPAGESHPQAKQLPLARERGEPEGEAFDGSPGGPAIDAPESSGSGDASGGLASGRSEDSEDDPDRRGVSDSRTEIADSRSR